MSAPRNNMDTLGRLYDTSGQPSTERVVDEEAEALLNDYRGQVTTIDGAMGGTDSETRGAWYALKSKCEQTIGSFVPLPRIITGPLQYEQVYRGGVLVGMKPIPVASNAYVAQAVAAHQDIREQLASSAPDLAQRMVDLALAGAVPTRPENASAADIAERKADLTEILRNASGDGRNLAAQKLIRQAVKDTSNSGLDGVNGALTLYTMLGGPMTLTIQGMPGLNLDTLRKICAQARYAADPRPVVIGNRPHPSAVAGAELIALFDTENDPRKLAAKALAYADHQLALTRALIVG